MAQTTESLKALSNMTSRTSCPRCEGFGFIHNTLDKHDKPDSRTRCKRCIICTICEGSGVVTGKMPCKPCKSRGFVHPISNHLREHNTIEAIRCSDCIECRECFGQGVVSAGVKNRTARSRQSYAPAPLSSNPGAATSSGPHAPTDPLLQSAAFSATTEASNTHNQTTAASAVHEKVDFEALVADMSPESLGLVPSECPRCNGLGWRHESSAKHDKAKSARCKNCAKCKACNGKGTLVGKSACPSCNTVGFIHESQERPHDVPTHLRCFFCKDCRTCNNIGVVDSQALIDARKNWVAEQKRLRKEAVRAAKAAERERLLQEQQQRQQLQPTYMPHVPIPPALPVVMVKMKDGTLVPSVKIPGVGVIPAEQVMRMKIPMAPSSIVPVSSVTAAPSSSGSSGQSPMASGMDVAEREAILRDVWG